MIKPYGNLLLVKEDKVEDKTTSSGIVLMASLNESSLRTGKIIDIGDGEYNYKGDLIPINGLDVGDIVYYNQNSGIDIEDENNEKFLLLNTKSVLAIKNLSYSAKDFGYWGNRENPI
jgi:co-chaperonin GroES (HSP10)